MSNIFLFSMPGGGELILLIFLLFFFFIAPILAIVYYLEAKRLRRENKELLFRLMERK